MSENKMIYKQMSKVMSEIGNVEKSQTNSAQGFKFRGIDQFVNALYPAMVKHGVFMCPRCISEAHELREVNNGTKVRVDKHVHLLMEYDFYAEDGSYVTIGPVPSEGLDSGDKATNKALSAALKYTLIQTFSIPTVDMEDADKESPQIEKSVASTASAAPVSPQQAATRGTKPSFAPNKQSAGF